MIVDAESCCSVPWGKCIARRLWKNQQIIWRLEASKDVWQRWVSSILRGHCFLWGRLVSVPFTITLFHACCPAVSSPQLSVASKSRVSTWLDAICLSWVFVYPQEWSGTQTWWRPWSCRTWCYAHFRPYIVQRHGRSHGELMPEKIIKYDFKIYHIDLEFSHLVLLIPIHFLCFILFFLKVNQGKHLYLQYFLFLFSFSESCTFFLLWVSPCSICKQNRPGS